MLLSWNSITRITTEKEQKVTMKTTDLRVSQQDKKRTNYSDHNNNNNNNRFTANRQVNLR